MSLSNGNTLIFKISPDLYDLQLNALKRHEQYGEVFKYQMADTIQVVTSDKDAIKVYTLYLSMKKGPN